MHSLQLLAGVVAIASAVQAKDKTPINPSLWPTIQRYTLFSAASETIGSGGTACPRPPFGSTVLKTISVEPSDTQATIFRDDAAKELIISFPGTASQQDSTTDFNETKVAYRSVGVYCPGCYAHGGFLAAWNSAAPEVQSSLEQYMKEYPDYKVTPTGHSLGGALALLCYSSLRGLRYPIEEVWTFGQPRIGDEKTAGYIDWLSGASDTKLGQVRRVTHSYDGVPQRPTLEDGFSHSRTEIWEADNSDDQQSASITYRCYGQDAPDCSLGHAQGFINAAHGTYTDTTMGNGAGCN